MGIVYHANYIIWMEIGRIEYCRAKGLRYKDLEEQGGILLTVVEANCRFSSPARYDQEVLVRTFLEEASPRMIQFSYEMVSADDQRILATGFTKHVFCGRDLKPKKLPEAYRHLFGIPT